MRGRIEWRVFNCEMYVEKFVIFIISFSDNRIDTLTYSICTADNLHSICQTLFELLHFRTRFVRLTARTWFML